MRLISELEWAEFFESVSLVDAALRAGSDFGAMDFATRNLYRSAIEELARGSPRRNWRSPSGDPRSARRPPRDRGADAGRRAIDPGYYLIAGGAAPSRRHRLSRAGPTCLAWRWPGDALGIGGYDRRARAGDRRAAA